MAERYRVIEARDLRAFAKELKERAGLQRHDAERIDGLLIDQMWRERADEDRTFRDLDLEFADERVRHLDAGVQLIGLMRNHAFSAKRPKWLDAYADVPIAIFTTITEYSDAIDIYLDSDVKNTVRGVLKRQISPSDPNGHPRPSEDIAEWFESVRKSML